MRNILKTFSTAKQMFLMVWKLRFGKKYVFYKRSSSDQEYVLEPEIIKKDLIESYKSKTREDMKSIAKLLNINVKEEDSAEDIRKKVINYIIKEKVAKKNN